MNTSVSPVTESEMNEWFKRLSTMIVSASVQSEHLARVQRDVEHLREELASLQGDNDKLKREVAETWQLVTNVEKERDEAKADIEHVRQDLAREVDRGINDRRDYEDRLAAAHDALAERDSRIAELEQRLATAQRESDEWQTKSNDAEQAKLRVACQADYWREHWEETDTTLRTANIHTHNLSEANTLLANKLESVQAKLAEVSSIFAPPPAPVEPVHILDKKVVEDITDPYSPNYIPF